MARRVPNDAEDDIEQGEGGQAGEQDHQHQCDIEFAICLSEGLRHAGARQHKSSARDVGDGDQPFVELVQPFRHGDGRRFPNAKGIQYFAPRDTNLAEISLGDIVHGASQSRRKGG